MNLEGHTMRRLFMAFPLLVLTLAGCAAAQPEPLPPEEDANAEACLGFKDETQALLAQFDGSGTVDSETHLDAIDTLALSAEGDVKERLLGFLDKLPSMGEILVYPEARELYNDLAGGVERACEASGTPVDVAGFKTD